MAPNHLIIKESKKGNHLNLSTVNTPDELVTQNNTPVEPNTSRLDALLEDLDLNETYKLSLKLLQSLGNYHQVVCDQLKEEGDVERLLVWAQDEQVLHTCYDLLHEVASNE